MKEFDNIDDYLLGLLSEADERAFLERVAQDQALAQQLAQRQKLIRGIQHKGRRALKAELETFHQQHQPQAAAPRPRRSRGAIKHSHLCLCVNRDDDAVCDLPGSFHHMGHVHRALARRSVFGPDHSMKHYRKVIDEQQVAGILGKKWPG